MSHDRYGVVHASEENVGIKHTRRKSPLWW